MRRFKVEKNLLKKFKKLFKKDKKRYEIVWKKINEICNCFDFGHYKNLRFPMNEFKRVHIDGSFVLIFKHLKESDEVVFYDLEHHDRIYK